MHRESRTTVTVSVVGVDGVPLDVQKGKGEKWSRPRTGADGSIEYPKRGTQRPPDIEGYIRDVRNPWRFIRIWNACKFRNEKQIVKPCGAIQILAICTCEACPLNMKPVKSSECESCPHLET